MYGKKLSLVKISLYSWVRVCPHEHKDIFHKIINGSFCKEAKSIIVVGKWLNYIRINFRRLIDEPYFRALSLVGTDFSMMETLFKKRNRHELKLKFKKEERVRIFNYFLLINFMKIYYLKPYLWKLWKLVFKNHDKYMIV